MDYGRHGGKSNWLLISSKGGTVCYRALAELVGSTCASEKYARIIYRILPRESYPGNPTQNTIRSILYQKNNVLKTVLFLVCTIPYT